MSKKKDGPQGHQILFAGDGAVAELLDGTREPVFVRELPVRYHLHVFRCADRPAELIELCCYTNAESPEPRAQGLFPDVQPPSGYTAVPAGWADNLKPKSAHRLYELAQKLNFTSAAATGKLQVAAKEWKAVLTVAAEDALAPFAGQLATSLISSLSAHLRPAAPSASSSSEKPSPG